MFLSYVTSRYFDERWNHGNMDVYDEMLEKSRLNNYTAEEIMTTGIAKLGPNDRIAVALEVFKENLFHAIPIVEKDELVGLITTFDIIRALSENR